MDTAYKCVHFSIRNWDMVSFIYIGLVLLIILKGRFRGVDAAYKSVHFSIRNWDMVNFI